MQEFEYNDFITRNQVSNNVNTFLHNYPRITNLINSGNVYLAGGAIRRMVENNPKESDYDLFIRKGSIDNIEKEIKDQGFQLNRETENHREYLFMGNKNSTRIQIMYNWTFHTPDQLLNFFDFTLCQCAMTEQRLYFGDYTLFDIAKRRIAINRITFFHSSLRRMFKYSNQGYYACAGTLQTFINSVLDNPSEARNGDFKYVD